MLKNLVNRESKKVVKYSLEFTDGHGSGFSFPCNRNGDVFTAEMSECARENLQFCLEHPEKFEVWNEVERWEHTYTEPAHGICTCGAEVYLYDEYYGACECENCGRWYNMFGQELLPPDQWEKDPSEEEYW